MDAWFDDLGKTLPPEAQKRLQNGRWMDDWWPMKRGVRTRSGSLLTPEALHPAFVELQRLYPPEYCRESLRDRSYPSGLDEFFFGNMYLHTPLLIQLGIDLSVIPGWEKDDHLVKGLQNVKTFHCYRVEVGIWASMRRNGYAVVRPERGATKTPDFVVPLSNSEVAIELKTLSAGKHDKKVLVVDRLLLELTSGFEAPRDSRYLNGHDINLHLEPGLIRKLLSLESMTEIRASLKKKLLHGVSVLLKNLATGTARRRTVKVPGLGKFSVAKTGDSASASMRLANLEMLSKKEQIVRLLRSVKEAAEQLQGYSHGIALIHTSSSNLPAEVATRELASCLDPQQAKLQHVNAIAVGNHFLSDEARPVHRWSVISTPWSEPISGIQELAESMSKWSYSH